MAKKAVPKGRRKKRTVQGKRGNPSRGKSVDPRGVIGIAVLCLGLLSLASQFIPSSGGFLNQCMLIVRGLGGTLCLLLPVVICWTGVVLVFFSEHKLSLRTLICGALVFLLVETMFQVFRLTDIKTAIYADGIDANYLNFLSRSYTTASLDCRGGGFIGSLLAWPLFAAFDIWGSVIVLIFALTIVLMVLTGVSFGGIGVHISGWLDDLRMRAGERREEKLAMRQAMEEAQLKRESEKALKRQNMRMEQNEEQEKAQKEEIDEPKKKARRPFQKEPVMQEQPDEEPPHTQELPHVQQSDMQTVQEETPRQGKHKGKVPMQVLTPEPDASWTPPPMRSVQQRTRTAPRSRTIRDDTTLYIERDDAFTRQAIDERLEGQQRRSQFTMEEAEQAFLYGMNQDEQPDTKMHAYAPQHGNTPSTYAPAVGYGADTAVQPMPGQPIGHDALNGNTRQDGNDSVLDGQPTDDDVQSGYTPLEREDVPMESSAAECDAQNEYPMQIEDDAVDSDVLTDDLAFSADDEDDEAQSITSVHSPGADAPVDSWNPEAEGVSAAFDAREAQLYSAPQEAFSRAERQPAPVFRPDAQEKEQEEQKTIVQLRGSRLDGTPLVVPQKDTHENSQLPVDEYVYPPIDLLNRSGTVQDPNQRAKDEAGAQKLLGTLESFGVQAKLIHVTHGPAITRYELQPAPGVKVSRIVNLVDDIALNMASDGVRIEAPIPGKPAVGIEIPNEKIEMVSLRDVLEHSEMTREKSPTAVALGKGISGAPVVADMAKMPHVLIAGATGSGKSVCINTIINSIIYRASPREVRLILIDPKVVELSVYNGIPHLLVPVVTDPKKASAALSWAVVEMEHRYKRFETMGVRDIRGYNAAIGDQEEPMSKIIVIIDELADLMMVAPGEVEESICRLAQLARAAGIHLVIATQRPSVNVITGVIKANIPSRIAFAVSSQIDSRTILDTGGAEKLLGKGDMLYAPQGASKPKRVQGCFVSDDEVQRIVEFVRGKHGADYNEDVIEQMNSAAQEEKAAAGDAPQAGEPVDEMLQKAIELAVDAGQVSISMLQRRLRVGYARAGRLVDEMTLRGITAEAEGPTKPRTVLISREEWRRMQENEE